MPKVAKRELTLAERRKRRRKRRPCGSNLPKEVTNIAGLYQRKESGRYTPWRVRVTWSKVTKTQANDDYKPDGYAIQLQGSADGTTWEKEDIRHKQVRGSAGEDGQFGTEDDKHPPLFVVFRNIKPKWYYRVRVRALSKDACDGEWPKDENGDPEWVSLGQASDNIKPNKPTNVTIYDSSKAKRIVVDWDPPVEADDSEIPDEGVTFFQIQLFKNSGFTGTPYRFDKIQATSRVSFRIADADLGDTFYARVRSIDAARNKSDWVPATSGGNSATGTTPTGVAVGSDSSSLPTSAPPSAPQPTVRRRIKSMVVSWEEPDTTSDQEPVIWEVHVSSTNNFTPVSTGATRTRVAQTRGDHVTITQHRTGGTLADLAAATTYYVKLVAKNRSGSGGEWAYSAASSQATSAGGSADATDQDTDTNGPTAAPTAPTGLATKRRLRAIFASWNDVQDDATQEPVKYQVFCGTSDPGASPSYAATMVVKGTSALITRYWNGSSYVDFTAANAGTTFHVRVRAKNAQGTAITSSAVTGSPKKKVSTKSESDSFGTDTPDVTDVIANRFIADDGTGDRIVIADTTGSKAKIQFIGGTSGSTAMTVGSAGAVTVTGKHIQFQSGSVAFYTSTDVTSPANTSAPNVEGSFIVAANKWWWKGSGGWRWVNANNSGALGGLGA